MPALTTSWYCDSCGRLIEHAHHGWVEWIDLPVPELASRQGRDIRIVHHVPHSPRPGGCQFNSDHEYAKDKGIIGDVSLPEFEGPDGLMRLLAMLAEQFLPTPALLEIIKRVHIPGYEHARRHFDRAIAEGVIQENVAPGYWWQDDIQRVLDYENGE